MRRFDQHALDVADRGFDEVRLPEQDLVGLDALRQRGGDLLQRLFDLARQPHGVDVGLLLDRNDDRGCSHVAGIAALDLGGEFDGGDLPEVDRSAVDSRHHDVAQVLEAGGAADVADEVFARILVGEAAAGVGAELRQRLFDLLVGDVERAKRRRIGRHPVLADFAAHRDHLRDARNGQQPRP